jgi:hypothetical protein
LWFLIHFFFYEGATELYGGVNLEQFCEWEWCGNLIYCKSRKVEQRFITVFLLEQIFEIEIPDLPKIFHFHRKQIKLKFHSQSKFSVEYINIIIKKKSQLLYNY